MPVGLPHIREIRKYIIHLCVCAKLLMSDALEAYGPRAYQALLSMGFSRQEYWSGLPFPSPGDLPNPGIKPTSLKSPALAVRFFTTSTTWEAHNPLIFSEKMYLKNPS